MKKLIPSLLGVSSLAAVAMVIISNSKRHAAMLGGTAALFVAQTNANAQMLINGAGATFPYPIYSKWISEYKQVDTSVRINYQSIGSGGGQKQITAQTVDFGASDGPMSDENLAQAPGKILHIPTVAGADVITYNLPGDPKLKLDGDVIVNIFMGNITKWNDPKITALNPGVNLPDQPIVTVHRADGSGTTFIFTDYLSSVSPVWADTAGKGTSVKWPAGSGLAAKGNEGVAGQVKQLSGAIGYVELIYAKQNNMPYADVKNSSGNFINPSLDSITAALATAKIPDDFRFSMVNPPGEKAYPIAGATWLLVYEQQKDAAKGKKLVEFLNWALSKGEAMATSLDYAPLPDEVQKRVLERIKTIKY
jgi:phosphate transport system substrate-binding protein